MLPDETLGTTNSALPAMTVPTQVPCGPLRRLVGPGSVAPGTNDSPPITVPGCSAATTGEFAVPLSITATITSSPKLPCSWSALAPMRVLLKR